MRRRVDTFGGGAFCFGLALATAAVATAFVVAFGAAFAADLGDAFAGDAFAGEAFAGDAFGAGFAALLAAARLR